MDTSDVVQTRLREVTSVQVGGFYFVNRVRRHDKGVLSLQVIPERTMSVRYRGVYGRQMTMNNATRMTLNKGGISRRSISARESSVEDVEEREDTYCSFTSLPLGAEVGVARMRVSEPKSRSSELTSSRLVVLVRCPLHKESALNDVEGGGDVHLHSCGRVLQSFLHLPSVESRSEAGSSAAIEDRSVTVTTRETMDVHH